MRLQDLILYHYNQMQDHNEYAGLLAIQEYHRSRGDDKRNVCLIPTSALELILHQQSWQV